MNDKARAAGWDGSVLLDAGDTLNPSPYIVPARRGAIEAVARFIIDEYNREGVQAMTLGERDLALGEATLGELAKRAKFPFLAANVLDRGDRRPAFKAWTVVEAAGIRIGVLGLVSEEVGKQAILGRAEQPAPPWQIEDPVAAAKEAVAALEGEHVDMIVALSHLKQSEEDAVAKAVPAIALFLGNHDMGITTETRLAGSAVSVSAGQKGKYLAITSVKLPPAWKAGDMLVDGGRREGLVGKIARSKQLIESLGARLERAKTQAAAGEPTPAGAAGRRAVAAPVAMWEQQLAGAKAELQLAEMELKDLEALDTKKDAAASAASLMFELVSLSPQVVDDPETKARVDAFRAEHADPASPPGH